MSVKSLFLSSTILPEFPPTIINYLTNRFHVAVRLFSNISQMTSSCGKNKKVAQELINETLLLWSLIYYSHPHTGKGQV